MGYNRKSPPRLSVEITEEQEQKLRELIPHGHKVHVFGAIVDDVIKLYEGSDPYKVTGAIVSKNLKLEHFAGNQDDN